MLPQKATQIVAVPRNKRRRRVVTLATWLGVFRIFDDTRSEEHIHPRPPLWRKPSDPQLHSNQC
jgi:hypothetical protein